MSIEYELRRYGRFGKYEGGLVIDQFVDNDEWFDAREGEADLGGHYGLIRGPFTSDQRFVIGTPPFEETLTEDERAYLQQIAGAIVLQTSQGFVSVVYYDSDEELTAAWARVEALHEPEEDDAGDDAEGEEDE